MQHIYTDAYPISHLSVVSLTHISGSSTREKDYKAEEKKGTDNSTVYYKYIILLHAFLQMFNWPIDFIVAGSTYELYVDVHVAYNS